MTASPEALAPTRRPSPRAVILAILVAALLVLFVYAGSLFVTPPLALVYPQHEFTFSLPDVGSPELVTAGKERVWLVRRPRWRGRPERSRSAPGRINPLSHRGKCAAILAKLD